ncbi:synapsin-2 [Thalassophryne amazonica]|uniref:synapsin-2 n=1 Tax=Thalassophryne amazonica TaxID=390379 RepID=UPI001470DCD0|nr:synapsin-2 [Thalassophryne amazonica]
MVGRRRHLFHRRRSKCRKRRDEETKKKKLLSSSVCSGHTAEEPEAREGWRITPLLSSQIFGLMMSLQRLPSIGSSREKTAKPTHSSTLQHHQRAVRRKCVRQPPSSSHRHPGPASILLPEATVTPWEGLALSSFSFSSISPPLPQLLPPPPSPPAPQPTTASPCSRRLNDDCSSSSSPAPSRPVQQAGGGDQGLQVSQRVLPQYQVPCPPHLPPLRPVTNLSFTRNFTFSYFVLPRHQSPHRHAERIRNLMLLLKQTRY